MGTDNTNTGQTTNTGRPDTPSAGMDALMTELKTAADTVTAEITDAAVQVSDAFSAQPEERPRVRWAAIVWGLLFAAIAAGTLAILLRPESRDAFAEWAFALSPLTVTLYGLLALGALVLVGGLAGLLRRAQRRRTQR